MKFIAEFLTLFFPKYNSISIVENDVTFSMEIEAESYITPQETDIKRALASLQDRDNLILTISFGNADPISLNSCASSYSEVLQSLEKEHSYQKNESIQASLTINKSKVKGVITLYDFDVFTSSLKKLNIAQVFSVFNRVLSDENQITFEVFDLAIPFSTSTMCFQNVGDGTPVPTEFERTKQLDLFRSSSYFKNIGDYNLIPDDFKVRNLSIRSSLIELFNHYAIVLSAICLFDITSIEDSTLDFKLNGYKSIKGSINIESPIPETEEYFNIYKWVYTGGNLNDKIGLARNIISLHFRKVGEISLNGNPFQAVRSSYKVYEKQNIKQYIDIRNKITDQLIDFNNRANKIIESFAAGFQKSALAVITFYSSAIVVRILGKGDFVGVFTLDTTILSIAFLTGSGLYYFVSRWEVLQQRTRFESSYSNMKIRYTDLLDKDDINRILNNDKEFNEDLKFINSKLSMYSYLWWGIILVLLFSTLVLFISYNLSSITEIPLVHFILSRDCHC